MSKVPTVISVINLKGGVGKTTVTALLARYAAYIGLDVLAVDMDPQANLSQALMGETVYTKFMAEKQPSIVELFNDFLPASENNPSPAPLKSPDIVKQVKYGYFSRSPVARDKKGKLEVIPSRFDFSDNLIHPTRKDERVLAKFIAHHMQHKDLILIDCAPTESILTRASYHASRYILIPVKTEFFSTIGFPLLKQSLEKFSQENRGHTIDVCGVLVNRTKTSGSKSSEDGKISAEDIMTKAKKYHWHVFDNWMQHSDAYPKWVKDPLAGNLRNAGNEWPIIAHEILTKIGLIKSDSVQ